MDDENFYTCGCRCSATAMQSVRVSAAFDDAEATQRADDTDGSGDLDLGVVLAGLRFANVAIPPGAGIVTAAVQFNSDQGFAGDNTTPLTLDVYAAAVDNAPSFGGNFVNLGALPHSATSVGWPVPPWTVQQSGAAQRTPNLSSLIQEIITRPGWQSGNAIALLFAAGNGRREAESFDGNSARAAVLEIQFVTYADQALNVCMPPDLNPNLDGQPIPTDDQLQADCADCAGHARRSGDGVRYRSASVMWSPVLASSTQSANRAPGAGRADCTISIRERLDHRPTPRATSRSASPRAGRHAGTSRQRCRRLSAGGACEVEGTATIQVDESETDAFGIVSASSDSRVRSAVHGWSQPRSRPRPDHVRSAVPLRPDVRDLASSGHGEAPRAVGPSGLGVFGSRALQAAVRAQGSDTACVVPTIPLRSVSSSTGRASADSSARWVPASTMATRRSRQGQRDR
jgi:hypothetical protein